MHAKASAGLLCALAIQKACDTLTSDLGWRSVRQIRQKVHRLSSSTKSWLGIRTCSVLRRVPKRIAIVPCRRSRSGAELESTPPFEAKTITSHFLCLEFIRTEASILAGSALQSALHLRLRLPASRGPRFPCRNIGSHQRIKYGLLGDGVNLAARMKGPGPGPG